jgi:hypothetical protein
MTNLIKPNRNELSAFIKDQRTLRAFEQIFELLPADLVDLFERAQDSLLEAGTAQSLAVSALSEIERSNLSYKGFNFVSKLSDLPNPVGSVITLKDYETYWFTNFIDLEGSRIVAGVNTVITGSSSENSKIFSTGLSGATALITSEWTLPIKFISLEHQTIVDLDATSNAGQTIDWTGVNLLNSSNIGTIQGYENFIGSACALLNSSGLVFDTSFDSIVFETSLISTQNTGTGITIPATLTLNKSFRLTNCSVVANGTATGLDTSTSASIPVEGYVLGTVNFSGSGTYTTGVAYDDNKSRWSECRGVINSASISGYYMINNATATVIASISVPVKVAGTTTALSISQRFTVSTTNRATYNGAIVRYFKVSVISSLTSGNNNSLSIYVYKNGAQIPESKILVTANAGGRSENASTQCIISGNENDYIEVWVENNSATNNITAVDLNVIIEALN